MKLIVDLKSIGSMKPLIKERLRKMKIKTEIHLPDNAIATLMKLWRRAEGSWNRCSEFEDAGINELRHYGLVELKDSLGNIETGAGGLMKDYTMRLTR